MNISKNSWHYRLWMICLTKSPLIRLFRDHDTFRTWVEGTWVKNDDGTDDYLKGYYVYHPPLNLCEYINRLPFFVCITLMVAICFTLFVGMLVVVPFIHLTLDLWFGQFLFGELSAIAVMWSVVGFVFGLFYLYHKYKNSVHMPKVVKGAVEKVAPTFVVVSTYIKDRHDKICRKLDFKDPE